MTRKIITYNAIAAAVFFFASAVSAHRWRYMINEHVAPLQIATANQPMKAGVVTEIVEAIFSDSNQTLEPILAPAKRIATLRKQDKSNYWLSYGAEHWKGNDATLSQEPLFLWRHVLVAKKTVRVQTIQDLGHLHLLLVHGYDYPQLEPYINHFNPSGTELTVSYVASPESALAMLAKGRGDAYIDIDFRANYHLKNQGLDGKYIFSDLSAIIPVFPIYLMMDKTTPKSQQAWLNQRLTLLKSNGTVERILAKYR